MSIDLKGNTNYVAFHDLEQGLVVPRTNLSAVDMNVGNGLEVNGDTINIREADAIQIVNGANTNAVITSEALRKALFMGSTSILDVTKQVVAASSGSITSTFDSDGMVVTGASADGVGGIKFVGPLAGMSEKEGKFLLVFDVYVSVNGAVTSFSCTGDTGIIFETIPGYTLAKTEQGSWVRCAALVDTTAGVYTGSLYFNVSTTSDTEYSFKLGNVRVQDATGLNSDEVQYLVLAGKINTTVEGNTVIVDGNNPYVFIPGEGVKIQEGVISMETSKAPAADIINNIGDMLLSNKNLHAALSSGKAVDVTSTPYSDAVGSIDTGIGIKGHITWNAPSGSIFGFYGADGTEDTSPYRFPKYAPGLIYLFLADVTNTGATNVTLTAEPAILNDVAVNNVLNGSLPVTITPGRPVRIAFWFNNPIKGFITATSARDISLAFDSLREYEVTGCSYESRNYIAKLTDPDSYNDYYLVDQDEVNPWLPIINMKSSPVVTITAGLSYKLYANDGETHTLMVDTIPPNTYGRDAKLELFIANADSSISMVSPLRMAYGNSFTANKLHNCSIRFQDGLATLTVDSIEDIFIVNLAGGTYTTESGTIYWGLNTDSATEVAFNSDTNLLECDMYNATANGSKELYGNGVDNTILVGSGTFGANSIILHQLQLKGATVSGSSIAVADEIAVQDSLTNNASITFGTGSTLYIAGASTSTSAVSGTGTMTFTNGTTLDASQNKAGGVILSNNVTVNTSASLLFKGSNGFTKTITGNKTGTYLFADGSIASTIYTVNSLTGAASGSLAYGINTAAVGNYIVFDHTTTDGNVVELDTLSDITRAVNIIGNGMDTTTVKLTHALNRVAVTGGYNFTDLTLTGHTGADIYFASAKGMDLNAVRVTGNTTDGNNYMFAVGSNQVVIHINNTLFESNNAGYGLFTLYGSTVSFSGCTFRNNATLVSMLRVGNAKTTIENCTFSGNTYSDAVGSAVLSDVNSTGAIVVKNCTFGIGQHIYIRNAAESATFEGTNTFECTIKGAASWTLAADTSLISETGSGTFDFSGLTGYGLSILNNNILIKGMCFKNKQSNDSPLRIKKPTQIIDCVFQNNNINNTFGGGIYIAELAGEVSIKGCTITGCTAAGAGPAICISTSATSVITVENCDIINNIGNKVIYAYNVSYPNTLIIKGSTVANDYGVGDYAAWAIGLNLSTTEVIDSIVNGFVGSDVEKTLYLKNAILRRHVNGGSTHTAQNITINLQSDSYLQIEHQVGSSDAWCALGNLWVPLSTIRSILVVGSYTDDTHKVFVPGGTISLRIKDDNGDITTTPLSGIGRYITIAGANDFSTPYMLTAASGTSDGSLYDGLFDADSIYLLPTYDTTSLTATIGSTPIPNQRKALLHPNGMPWLDGIISLPENATINASYSKDTYGAVNLSGSTITISGGTPTFSGDVFLLSKLLVSNTELVLADNTRFIGRAAYSYVSNISYDTSNGNIIVGPGCMIANMKLDKTIELPVAGTVTIKGCTTGISKTPTGVTVVYNTNNAVADISNCVFNGVGCYGGSVIVTDSTFNNTAMGNQDSKLHLYTNCVFNAFIDHQSNQNSLVVIKGCTCNQTSNSVYFSYDNSQKFVFDGYTTFKGYMAVEGEGTNKHPCYTEVTYIIAGSTISLVGNPNAKPIIGAATKGVKVGTFSNAATYNGTWTTGGSATVILADGSTQSISGEGTYIQSAITGGTFTDIAPLS